MTRSGIDEQIIVNQLASSGLQRPLQANDVIYLQQNGVSPHVISIMQQTRVAVAMAPPGAVVVPAGPPPVVVASPYYGPYIVHMARPLGSPTSRAKSASGLPQAAPIQHTSALYRRQSLRRFRPRIIE